jgi:hypothetical protein
LPQQIDLGVPTTFVDGRIDRIDIEIPWKQFINSNVKMRVAGFQLLVRVSRDDFAAYLQAKTQRETAAMIRTFQRQFERSLKQERSDWAQYLEKEIMEKIEIEIEDFGIYLLVEGGAESQVLSLSLGRLSFCESQDYKAIKKVDINRIDTHLMRLTRADNSKQSREDLRELRKLKLGCQPVVSATGISVRIFRDAAAQRVNFYATIQTIWAEFSHKSFNILGHFIDAFDLIRYLRARQEGQEFNIKIQDAALAQEVSRFEALQKIKKLGRWKYRKEYNYAAKLEKVDLGLRLEFCRLAEDLKPGNDHSFNVEHSISFQGRTYSAKTMIQEGFDTAKVIHRSDLRAILERVTQDCRSPEYRQQFCQQRLVSIARKPSMLQKLLKPAPSFKNFFDKVQSKVSKQNVEGAKQPDVYLHHTFTCMVENARVSFENRGDTLVAVESTGLQVELLGEVSLFKIESLKLTDDSAVYSEFPKMVLEAVANKKTQSVEVELSPFHIKLNSYILAKLYFCFHHPIFKRDKVVQTKKKGGVDLGSRPATNRQKVSVKIDGVSMVTVSNLFDFGEGMRLSFGKLKVDGQAHRLSIHGVHLQHYSEEDDKPVGLTVMCPVNIDLSLDNHIQLLKFEDIEFELNEKVMKFGQTMSNFWKKLTTEFYVQKPDRSPDADAQTHGTHTPSISRKGSDDTV